MPAPKGYVHKHITVHPSVWETLEKHLHSDTLGRVPYGAMGEFIQSAIVEKLSRAGVAPELPDLGDKTSDNG